MAAAELSMDLCCPNCGWLEVCDRKRVETWLRTLGMLKRNPHASVEELRELLLAAAPRFTCPACGRIGLAAREAVELSVDWETFPRCEACGDAIPRERLEIFPHTRLCVACQQRTDRGESTDPVEYCPKCGWPMAPRQTRSAGITRYVMSCTREPPCSR